MPATDSYFRKLSTLHIVFAISMLSLFVATMWMMAADHRDEWRTYQSQMDRFVAAKNRDDQQSQMAALVNGDADAYKERVDELTKQLEKANVALGAADSKIPSLTKVARLAENEAGIISREVKTKRAERDVARANYDIGVRDQVGKQKATLLMRKFQKEQAEVKELELKLEGAERDSAAAAAELSEATSERDEVKSKLGELVSKIDLLQASLDKIAPESSFNAAKRWLMEKPIIDGFNSHHKIIQDWIPDLHQTLGMTSTARFDRCRTCHLGIDQSNGDGTPMYPHGELEGGGFPHPFSTHPRTDVYLSAASPHPLPEFGCTSCHEGQGSGTSFQNAAHGPNDPFQAHEWKKEFGWFDNHFWEYPQLPERLREAACIKCHHSVIELGVNKQYGPTAPKVYEGWQIVRQFGCFGCHEIHGFDGATPIGPDLRLEPRTEAERLALEADPNQVPGKMRKVGPSLEHIGQKTTGVWLENWTEMPSRFRPSTRMPQFFGLSIQPDKDSLHGQFEPVEIAAVAHYLLEKSSDVELLSPKEGYKPNADRGKTLFSQRGCLACHQHSDAKFKDSKATFGPDLSRVNEKIIKGEAGFRWLYTWIRDPERHHPKTKMPNLFLEPGDDKGEFVDPAADIAAFLLTASGEPLEYHETKVDEKALNDLVRLYLSKALTTDGVNKTFGEFGYSDKPKEEIKGDEIELAVEAGSKKVSKAEWRKMMMNYVGRRTISQYGCYGCHEIPGFEKSRPIGTTLQDWGRKDRTKLALEHIEEFLHHHGEADGSSTRDRIAKAMQMKESDSFKSEEAEAKEMRTAFFFESLLHHGRPGFIWQKLRHPRSYDYEKLETKGYDERLRMPKFPFSEEQIEAVATFILGLVAEPPMEKYQFRPDGAAEAIVEGERILQKYNCGGCHMLELPEFTFGMEPDGFRATNTSGQFPEALELLLKMKPPRNPATGEFREFYDEELEETVEAPVFNVKGLVLNHDEFDGYALEIWETLKVDDKLVLPTGRVSGIYDSFMIEKKPPKGGDFAFWLVDDLVKTRIVTDMKRGWTASPPPLVHEGHKVQTPWLYQFLKNPHRIRPMTVLRMPRFNMSDDEARTLANYFAAVDGTEFPYQQVPVREPAYLTAAQAGYAENHPERAANANYLKEAWETLNAPLCIKCHAVGGRPFQNTEPDPQKVTQGPNLQGVADRLRPEWVMLWLYNPAWVTPYTAMPVNFPMPKEGAKPTLPGLFDGDANHQTIGVRDALINYHRLLEQEGKYPITAPAAAPAAGEAGGS
ncbi:MAG: hypothetical protein CMJ78_08800 [Planctomycetaceae bacterium]|nr:hypothetical protein [Planctomycetaceae bacterium]